MIAIDMRPQNNCKNLNWISWILIQNQRTFAYWFKEIISFKPVTPLKWVNDKARNRNKNKQISLNTQHTYKEITKFQSEKSQDKSKSCVVVRKSRNPFHICNSFKSQKWFNNWFTRKKTGKIKKKLNSFECNSGNYQQISDLMLNSKWL